MYCRFSFRRLKEAGGGRGTNYVGEEGVGRRRGGGRGEEGREQEEEGEKKGGNGKAEGGGVEKQ